MRAFINGQAAPSVLDYNIITPAVCGNDLVFTLSSTLVPHHHIFRGKAKIEVSRKTTDPNKGVPRDILARVAQ